MKKIFVTGGNGLVGQGIKSISSNYNDHYEFMYLGRNDCDLLHYNNTITFFEKHKPDYVIHLAANVGGLFKNMEYPVQMLEDNLLINMNVIKASHCVNVKKLIACLSTCIFPNEINYPITEEQLHNGPPHFSNAGYAYSKRILQTLCETYQKQYNDNFICIIPTNIYGINDNFHLEDAHVIPALIHKCFLAKENNNKFMVSGSGKPLRQFIYSIDLAKMIMWCLLEYNEKQSLILCTDDGDELTIEYVSKQIAKEFDYEEHIHFDNTKADGQYKKTASNQLFRKYNPEFTFTSFNHGIKETVKWFKENYPNIRK